MVEKTKFLCVIIDQNMSFQSHINYIKGKVASGIGILYKSRTYFNLETMRALYDAFFNIYPYFTYCIEVWGNTSGYQSYLKSLVKMEKRAIRTIVEAWKYAHTAPLFPYMKLLNIKEILYITCNHLCINITMGFCLRFFRIYKYEIIQFMNMIPYNRISSMCR